MALKPQFFYLHNGGEVLPPKVLVKIKWVMYVDHSVSSLTEASDLATSLTPYLQPHSSSQRVKRKMKWRGKKQGERRRGRGDGGVWPVPWACAATCLTPPVHHHWAPREGFPTQNELHASVLLTISGGGCYDFSKIMETRKSTWKYVIVF